MSQRLAPAEKSLGKLGEVKLDLIPRLQDCDPGLEPTAFNVVVVLARMPDKIGQILLPDEIKDTYEMAMQAVRIVSASPIAFNYDRWEGCADAKPKPGDIVWIAKYAGALFDGKDGKQYRIILDKDIGAKIPEASTVVDLSALPAGSTIGGKVWELDSVG